MSEFNEQHGLLTSVCRMSEYVSSREIIPLDRRQHLNSMLETLNLVTYDLII